MAHLDRSAATTFVAPPIRSMPLTEPKWVRWILIGTALVFLGLFLILPLAVVFLSAFENGWRAYGAAILDPEALSALRLTIGAAAVCLVLNTTFGLAAAWAVTRFRFPGKSLLISFIDLPFAVSPVVAGLMFMLLFGLQGALGPFLAKHDLLFAFTPVGVVLATLFVTFPFVARELIPLLQAQGPDEEEAAMVLGATGPQIFLKVTLPNIRWGLLYGMILCNARAMGEFGAVSVVSGHIRGWTSTLPLHVEILYNEYQSAAAFAVASLLALLALVTLAAKSWVENRFEVEKKESTAGWGEGL